MALADRIFIDEEFPDEYILFEKILPRDNRRLVIYNEIETKGVRESEVAVEDRIFKKSGFPDEFIPVEKILPQGNVPVVIHRNGKKQVVGEASIDENGVITTSFFPCQEDPCLDGKLPAWSFSFEVNRHDV